jgi:pimeloyl-ACP methyl ester carboxylesterase
MPYAKNNGVNVYYESHGQGVPVTFLHPFSTNGYIWYFQIFPFAQTNQCVVIDERGHGRSDKPQQGYAIQEMAKDVAAVLDELKIDKTVLVGNSIGGMIAMQFNLDYPARVLGNVIVSSGTGVGQNMPPEAAEAFQKDYQGAFTQLLEGTVSAKTKRERAEILDLMKAHFLVQSNFPSHVFMAASQDPNGVFNWNVRDQLKNIRKPTLVLAGEEDQGTTVEINKVLSDNIPNAELRVIKDVGHFYQLEKPYEFNQALRQFLNQVAM